MAKHAIELVTDAWNVTIVAGAVEFRRGSRDAPMERVAATGEWISEETEGQAYVLFDGEGKAQIHKADDATWAEPDAEQYARELATAPLDDETVDEGQATLDTEAQEAEGSPPERTSTR